MPSPPTTRCWPTPGQRGTEAHPGVADWTFSAGVLNLFSLRKYNQEYFYLSRLNTEPAGVWDRHVRKADPQAVRFEITRRF